jgi:hypothetical protein
LKNNKQKIANDYDQTVQIFAVNTLRGKLAEKPDGCKTK